MSNSAKFRYLGTTARRLIQSGRGYRITFPKAFTDAYQPRHAGFAIWWLSPVGTCYLQVQTAHAALEERVDINGYKMRPFVVIMREANGSMRIPMPAFIVKALALHAGDWLMLDPYDLQTIRVSPAQLEYQADDELLPLFDPRG